MVHTHKCSQSTMNICREPDQYKTFSETLIKGQREPSSVSLFRSRHGKANLELVIRALKELRFQFLRIWLLYEETGIISTKAAVCLFCMLSYTEIP